METIRFEDLELDAKIMRAITDMGFEAASPIQGQAIPLELQGLDIIGQAQTGTGKTAAFGIPLLQKIDPKNKKPQAIILCPTRELAIQVSEEIRRLAKYMHGVKVQHQRSQRSGNQSLIHIQIKKDIQKVSYFTVFGHITGGQQNLPLLSSVEIHPEIDFLYNFKLIEFS